MASVGMAMGAGLASSVYIRPPQSSTTFLPSRAQVKTDSPPLSAASLVTVTLSRPASGSQVTVKGSPLSQTTLVKTPGPT